jgi:hypothetical protein
MDLPEHFEMAENFARFVPLGHVSLQEAVAKISRAIAYTRNQKVRRLLVNITELTGFAPPSLGERYWFVMEWAREAGGIVTVAMVARAEFIDAEKFGVIVASVAGLRGDVFVSEPEALSWLSSQ